MSNPSTPKSQNLAKSFGYSDNDASSHGAEESSTTNSGGKASSDDTEINGVGSAKHHPRRCGPARKLSLDDY